MEKHFVPEIKQFGLLIKKLRQDHDITQQELADRCDVDIRTIQRIERGEHGLGFHILLGLAHAFKIQPSDLLAHIKIKNELGAKGDI